MGGVIGLNIFLNSKLRPVPIKGQLETAAFSWCIFCFRTGLRRYLSLCKSPKSCHTVRDIRDIFSFVVSFRLIVACLVVADLCQSHVDQDQHDNPYQGNQCNVG